MASRGQVQMAVTLMAPHVNGVTVIATRLGTSETHRATPPRTLPVRLWPSAARGRLHVWLAPRGERPDLSRCSRVHRCPMPEQSRSEVEGTEVVHRAQRLFIVSCEVTDR